MASRQGQNANASSVCNDEEHSLHNYETSVAEAHNALVAAGHSWAQHLRIPIAAKTGAGKSPHEWNSKPISSLLLEQILSLT